MTGGAQIYGHVCDMSTRGDQLTGRPDVRRAGVGGQAAGDECAPTRTHAKARRPRTRPYQPLPYGVLILTVPPLRINPFIHV